MKKIIFLLLLIVFPTFVYAHEYKTQDLTINIDDSIWQVYTGPISCDTIEMDNNILKCEVVNELMTTLDSKIFAYKINFEDKNDFIYMSITTSLIKNKKLGNLHTYTDKDVQEIGQSVCKELSCDSFDIFRANKYKYLQYYIYDKDLSIYQSTFSTYMNGYSYLFSFYKPTEFNSKDNEILDSVIGASSFEVNSKYEHLSTLHEDNSLPRFIGEIIGAIIAFVIFIGILKIHKKGKNNIEGQTIKTEENRFKNDNNKEDE